MTCLRYACARLSCFWTGFGTEPGPDQCPECGFDVHTFPDEDLTMETNPETNPAPLATTEPGYVDEQDPQVSSLGGWRIDSLGSADWALSRVADLEEEIEENEAVAAEAMKRLELRTKVLNDRAMRGVNFFRAKLAEFAEVNRTLLLKGGKKKSRELQHGRIGWRERGGKLQAVDQDALLAWALSQPVELGLVRRTEAPDLVSIKAYAKAHNLIPPGMVETPSFDELYVDTNTVSVVKKGGE